MLINLLRLLPPELAHEITIKVLKSNFNFNSKNIKIYKSLKQTILGINFKNPIGLAAGFDKNAEVINQMLAYGFGFVEIGTVTPKKQKGNEKPRVFRLLEDEAIINHLGFNNKGSEKILSNLKSFYDKKDINQIVGINIGKNKSTQNDIDDYLALSNNPPDLLIRTGGDHRLSNFMLWQHAYTELYFTDCLWPNFDEVEFDKAIKYYLNTTRKFGGLVNINDYKSNV